tara:strand:- start:1797 stop:1934 length:138 start_codon:yes stop_codon:yes gene_type:complete
LETFGFEHPGRRTPNGKTASFIYIENFANKKAPNPPHAKAEFGAS